MYASDFNWGRAQQPANEGGGNEEDSSSRTRNQHGTGSVFRISGGINTSRRVREVERRLNFLEAVLIDSMQRYNNSNERTESGSESEYEEDPEEEYAPSVRPLTLEQYDATITDEMISSELESEDKSCIICLDKLMKNQICSTLPCNHTVGHTACVKLWLMQTSGVCPVCKSTCVSSAFGLFGRIQNEIRSASASAHVEE